MFTGRGVQVSSQTRLYRVRTNSRTVIVLCPVSDVPIDSKESPGCSVEISGDLHGKTWICGKASKGLKTYIATHIKRGGTMSSQDTGQSVPSERYRSRRGHVRFACVRNVWRAWNKNWWLTSLREACGETTYKRSKSLLDADTASGVQ